MEYAIQISLLDDLSKQVKSMTENLAIMGKEVQRVNNKLDQTSPELERVSKATRRASKQTRGWLGEINNLNRSLKKATALVGAAFGFEKISSWTGQAIAGQQEVANSFGLTGQELDTVTNQVQRMSDIFGSDVNATLASSRNLMNSFGLDAQDSLGLMQRALDKGVSADTINSIASLAPKFQQAGISAEAFFAKMIQADRLGTAKELEQGLDHASKTLNNLAKNVNAQEALAALGFNPKAINKALQDGSMSVAQVIEEISNKVAENGEGSEKAAKALENIFGDSSKNMGIAIAMLQKDAPNALIQIENRTTTATAAQQKLFGAWSDIKNLITNTVLPVFVQVIDWIYANQEMIRVWSLRIGVVAGSFLAVWGAAKTIMGIQALVGGLTTAWQLLGLNIKIAEISQIAFNAVAMLNPLGWVVVTIAAIGLAIYALVEYWDDVTNFLAGMGEMLMKMNPLSWLIDALTWLFPAFGEAWEGFVSHFTEYAQKAWEGFTSFFIDPFNEWVNWFQGWWDWFTGEAAVEISATTEQSQKINANQQFKEASVIDLPKFGIEPKLPLAESIIMGRPEFIEKSTGTTNKSIGISQALGNVVGDSRQAKNITINIGKLIESFTIATTTVGENQAKIKEAVLNALMGAVNDANVI